MEERQVKSGLCCFIAIQAKHFLRSPDRGVGGWPRRHCAETGDNGSGKSEWSHSALRSSRAPLALGHLPLV